MKTMNLKLPAIVAAVLLCIQAGLSAAEPAKEDAVLSAKLISAIEKSDFAAFIADGEVPFQQLKKEQFAAVAAQLSPLLQAKHEVSYLGEMKKHGYRVTLWRISFQSGGDDLLATLSVRDGRVGGFFLK